MTRISRDYRKYLKGGVVAALAVLMAAVVLVSVPVDEVYAVDYTDESSGLVFTLDTTNKTATVGNNSGIDIVDLVIPASITYGGEEYAVTSISGHAFENSAIVTATIPDTVEKMGTQVFAGTGLITITLPDSLGIIDASTFLDCHDLRVIVLGAGTHAVSELSIDGATNLEVFVVPDDNPYLKAVDGILYSKDGTELLLCPEGFRGDVIVPEGTVRIDVRAFESCQYISGISLPDSLVDIGSYAFAYCTGLTDIVLPASVSILGENAFIGFDTDLTIQAGTFSFDGFVNTEPGSTVTFVLDGHTDVVCKDDSDTVFTSLASMGAGTYTLSGTPVGGLVFTDLASYDIPPARTGASVETITLVATGGTGALTFSKVSGPEWVIVSADGGISGTRPLTGQSTSTAVIKVEDEAGASRSITISVGKVEQYSVSADVPSIDFVATYGYEAIDDHLVTITNTGNMDVYLEALIDGANYAYFREDMVTAVNLVPGQSLQVTVSVGDSYDAGAYSATLIIRNIDESDLLGTIPLSLTVKDPALSLSGIAVTTAPSDTSYVEGEAFDPTGMVVTATYSDDTTAVVTNYIVTDGSQLTMGQETVTISFTDGEVTKTVTQAVTVTEAPIPTYVLNIVGGKGYVGDDPSVATDTVTGLHEGDVVNITADTRDGFTFGTWIGGEGSNIASAASASTTVVIATMDCMVFADFLQNVDAVELQGLSVPEVGDGIDTNIYIAGVNPPVHIAEIWWTHEGESFDGTYDYGRTYELHISFTIDDGYTFTSDTIVTVDGIVMQLDLDTNIASAEFTAPDEPINRVILTYDDPTDGGSVTVEPTIDSYTADVTVTGAAWLSSTGEAVTGIFQPATTYQLRFTLNANEYHMFSDSVTVYLNGEVVAATKVDEDTYTVMVEHTTPDRMPTPQVVFTATDSDGGMLVDAAGMEYRMDSGEWIDVSVHEFLIHTPGPCTIEVRAPSYGEYWDSEVQVIDITKATVPVGITVTGCTSYDDDDGLINGLDSTMEYRLVGDDTWTVPVASSAQVHHGDYEVRVAPNGTVLASDNLSVTIESSRIHVGTEAASGTGYDYTYDASTKEGVLTLDGFRGSNITIDNEAGVTTIVLKGENVLSIDNPDEQIYYVIMSMGSLVFDGDGSLVIDTDYDGDMTAVFVDGGFLTIGGTGAKTIDMSASGDSRAIYNGANLQGSTDNGDITISGTGKVAITIEGSGTGIMSGYELTDNTDGSIVLDGADVTISGGDVAIHNMSQGRDTAVADILVMDSSLSITGSADGLVSVFNGILLDDSRVTIDVSDTAVDLDSYSSYKNTSSYGLVVEGGSPVSLASSGGYSVIMGGDAVISASLTEGGSLTIDTSLDMQPVLNSYVSLDSTTVVAGGKGVIDYLDEHDSIEGAYYIKANDARVIELVYKAYSPIVFTDDAKYDVPEDYVNTWHYGVMIDTVTGGRDNKVFSFDSEAPSWLSIDPDVGVISGQRPLTASDASTVTIMVDDRYTTATIVIDIGAVLPATAEVGDVTISGMAGEAMSQTLVVDLVGITFHSQPGGDVTSWFTDLPEGLYATYNNFGQSMISLVIHGIPLDEYTGVLSITIPAEVLEFGDDLVVTTNPDARIVIGIPDLKGTVTVIGDFVYGQTVRADVSGITNNSGTLAYQWQADGVDIIGATSVAYTLTASEVGRDVTVKVTSSIQTGYLASTARTVDKLDGPVAPTVSVVKPSAVDAQDGRIVGVDTTMEWSVTPDFADATACTGTEVTGLAAGTYYVRVAETGIQEAGAHTEVKLSSITYMVTVTGGTGSGEHSPGASVTIKADAPAQGKVFAEWSYTGNLVFTSGGHTTMEVTFTMPNHALDITAVYDDILYTLTVVGGTAGPVGEQVGGTTMTITADAPAQGKAFKMWSFDGELVFVEGTTATSAVAKFTMPYSDVTITAVYTDIHYAVTVTNGTASPAGGQLGGTAVTITADAPAQDMRFKEWSFEGDLVFLDGTSRTSSVAKFTMPYANVAITAVYEDIPALEGVVGIGGKQVYGKTLTVSVSSDNSDSNDFSVVWKRGDTEVGTGISYTIVAADIGGIITCVVTASDRLGSISASTEAIEKAAGPDMPDLSAEPPSYNDGEDGMILGVDDTMEWYSSPDFSHAYDCTGTSIEGLAAGTYYVRVAETDTHKAGAMATVVVPNADADLRNLEVINGHGSNVYEVGTMVTITASTIEGKAFDKWTFDGELEFVDGTTNASSVARIVMPDENITIVANYLDTYTVTFDTDGRCTAPGPYTDVVTGTTIDVPEMPPVTGYLMGGWYGDIDMTQAWDFATDVVTGDITLYCKWVPVTYTVAYDPNLGTGTMDPSSMQYDTAADLRDSSFVRTDFVFDSWNTRADGMGTSYADGQSVVNLADAQDATVTLYAQWEAVVYTIAFDSAGGSAVDPIHAVAGAAISAPDAPVRDGHDFVGWYLDGSPFVFDVMPSGGAGLVAVWDARQYTVTFDPDNGGDVITRTFDCCAEVLAPTGLVKEGYQFAGWSPALPVTMPAEDIEVKAQWVPRLYTVTFDPDNGTDAVTLYIFHGAAITQPSNPVRTGYTFAGWSPALPDTMPAEDLEVKALWTVNKYPVTFVLGNGDDDVVVDVDYMARLTAPVTPERDGWHFAGWSPVMPATMPAGELVFTAIWSEDEPVRYTMSFDSDGGSDVPSITSVSGVPMAAPEDPVRYGYQFLGWFAEGSDTAYTFVTTPAEDTSLKARWDVMGYDVIFMVDGSVYQEQSLPHGTVPTLPEVPVRAPEHGVTYTFAGWDGFTEGMTVTADLEFVAVFDAIYDAVDEDSIILGQDTMDAVRNDMYYDVTGSLEVVLGNGSIIMDKGVILRLGHGTVDVTISMVAPADLPSEVASKVGDRPVFAIDVGGVHDFGDGRLTITLDYTLQEGESANDLKVWHFGYEWAYDRIGCVYDDGTVTFEAGTLSYFAIMVDKDASGGGGSMWVYAGIVLAGVVAIVLLVTYYRRPLA